MENDDVLTKSIVIFIIEIGVWVIRACPNFGCNGRPFFAGVRLPCKIMMLVTVERV